MAKCGMGILGRSQKVDVAAPTPAPSLLSRETVHTRLNIACDSISLAIFPLENINKYTAIKTAIMVPPPPVVSIMSARLAASSDVEYCRHRHRIAS
jgi:hypothetical protein